MPELGRFVCAAARSVRPCKLNSTVWLAGMLSSDFMRRVLDSAPDAMVIIDASGSILYVNNQVASLFGHEPEELIGQPVECLLPERFRAKHIGHRQRYLSNLRARPMASGLDLFALRKDRSEFPVEISLSPAADGARTLVVAAIRDTTDRRQIRMELREARELADHANQAKSRFLATASHDLRQPLQALSLLNGAMRRMVKDADLVDAVSQSEQAIAVMSRLLNALLDISKLDSGAVKPSITDFKVATLFEELRTEFAPLAANKGLRLHFEPCAEQVRSDQSLVGQIVRNLVSNAIKYTREGFVRVCCLRERGCVNLKVLDTGIGIPAGELVRIYDEFYQVGSATNVPREGYGLGLSIVSRIVTLLNLRLEVQSVEGKGTTFSLALPASAAAAEACDLETKGTGPVTDGGGDRVRVLLVDDDPRVLNATRILLRIEGYEVITAASPAEALRRAAEHPDIRLLVTDYHLAANETGIEVLTSVRSILGADLPAVLVTGDTSAAVRELSSDVRLRAVSKPIRPDELLALFKELLAN
jgi:PAS domain S-box-containing protein